MDQEKYQIQVRPPGDLLPNIIRDLIVRQNISNAAILYDETFGKNKYTPIFTFTKAKMFVFLPSSLT